MNIIKSDTIYRSKSEPTIYSKMERIHQSNSDPNISITSNNINKSKIKHEKIDDLLKFIRNDMNKVIPDNKKYLDSYKI